MGKCSDAQFKNVTHQRIDFFHPKCTKTHLHLTVISKIFPGVMLRTPIIKGKWEGWTGHNEAWEGRDGREGEEDGMEGRAGQGGEGIGGNERPET